MRIAALSLLLVAPAARAADHYGRVNLGAYQSKETHSTESAGTKSNDQQAALGSFYLDVTKIGPFHNEFTLDFRDRYDSFAARDPDQPRLVEANEPQLRELAVKYPYEAGDLYWSLGRFPVADAAVLGNDGGELGYRVSPTVRLGLFGGLHPEHRDGKTLEIADEDRQEGVYAIYQDRTQSWDRNVYAATSVVARQPVTVATDEPEAADQDTDTVAQNYPAVPAKNRAFWYTNVVYQPASGTRLTWLSHVDAAPEAHARNLWASYFRQLSPRLSTTVSVLRLDLTEYERQRDIRDSLPASTWTQGRGDVRFKLSKFFLIQGDTAYGTRGLDSKTRAEGNARFVASSLFTGHVSAYAGGGYRKNFESRDTIARFGASFYAPKVEISLNEQYIEERHDDGTTLHPSITDLTLGYLLGEQTLGSLTLEYADDERVTIVSGLLTLGFRFGAKQLTPVRDDAPRVERL